MNKECSNRDGSTIFNRIKYFKLEDMLALVILLWYNNGVIHFNSFKVLYVYVLFIAFVFIQHAHNRILLNIKQAWPLLLFLITIFPSAIILYGTNENNLHEIICAIIICYFARYYLSDTRSFKGVTIASILLLDRFCVAVVSIVRLISSPELSRYTAQGSTASVLENISLYMLGGYTFVYSSVILVVALIATPHENRVIPKYAYYIYTITTFAFILYASYTLALIITLLFTAIVVLFKKKNQIWRILMIVLILIAGRQVLLISISWMAEQSFVSHVISNKLQYFQLLLSGKSIEGTSLLDRIDLYGVSNTFMKDYFWFGSFESPEVVKQLFGFQGMHTEWTSMIGVFGIFRYSLFCAFLFKQYKHLANVCACPQVIRMSFFILLVIGFVNPVINTQTFLVILFMVPNLIRNKETTAGGNKSVITD